MADRELPYQVVFLSGILVGSAINVLQKFAWTVVTADHEGFEVVTPLGKRLRVRVEEVEGA